MCRSPSGAGSATVTAVSGLLGQLKKSLGLRGEGDPHDSPTDRVAVDPANRAKSPA
jgi:hypothetical protein